MRKRLVAAAALLVVASGLAGCSSQSGDTAREGYCYSARLDFEKVIHTAVDPLAKASDRESARSILGLFASNGKEWIGDAPRRLFPASRTLVRAVRAAVAGDELVLANTKVTTALRDIATYAERCQ
jgi:hypothetical protein